MESSFPLALTLSPPQTPVWRDWHVPRERASSKHLCSAEYVKQKVNRQMGMINLLYTDSEHKSVLLRLWARLAASLCSVSDCSRPCSEFDFPALLLWKGASCHFFMFKARLLTALRQKQAPDEPLASRRFCSVGHSKGALFDTPETQHTPSPSLIWIHLKVLLGGPACNRNGIWSKPIEWIAGMGP